MKESLPSSHLHSTNNNKLLSNTWMILLATTIWYAPLAFDYFFPYQFGHSLYDVNATDSAWDQHFVQLTSHDYAMGEGSIREYFHDKFAIKDTRLSMWIHATTGATTLTLMTLQFIPPLRKNYPKVHRFTGYAALMMEMLSLSGSAHHLWVQGAHHFSGKDFTVALWVMWIFAATALIMSFLHIAIPRFRNVRRHYGWAALNYGAINSAPGLRLIWWGFHAFGFEGTLADCNAAAALLDFVAVGVGTFSFLTVNQPLKAFDGEFIQNSSSGKVFFVLATLFSYIGVVGLAQQMFGLFPNLNFWGDYSVELDLAQSTVPIATVMAFCGFIGSLLVAPVYTYQTLTAPEESSVITKLRVLLYACFAVCSVGLYYYVPAAISPALHNSFTAFYITLVALQWFCLAMELLVSRNSGIGAQQVWAMVQWANLCTPAFVFAVWPLFPYVWDFNRLEAYNSCIQVCLVPWVAAFLATLYLPTTTATASTDGSSTTNEGELATKLVQ